MARHATGFWYGRYTRLPVIYGNYMLLLNAAVLWIRSVINRIHVYSDGNSDIGAHLRSDLGYIKAFD